MARRGSGGGMGGGGMMAPVLSVATGLLIFVVLQIFAPTIAGTIQETQPAVDAAQEICSTFGTLGRNGTCALPGTNGINVTGHSPWNTTFHTEIPTGVDAWTTNIQILGVVILIISISIAMYFLKTMA